MVTRKKSKKKKKRGSRTMGGGSVKKRRHSGHKGGKGLAGSHKHRWFRISRESPKHFGKHGFTRPQKLQESKEVMNVGELDESIDILLEDGIAEEEDDMIVVDVSKLDCDKVLGRGKVSQALRVIADDFSESAKEKIEKAGGEVISGES
ncbi:MAG: uL15 family ribosomal protein [Hadesarchaea archaeon]|nr:uL15 family ribosomal protein [Hadesarchaea archaeon]